MKCSSTSVRAFTFITEAERPTAGQVRAHLGVPPKTWPNPADDALAELQRQLLIDRGAADVPEAGSPYLSKDGIPYRVFDRAHAALVNKAAKLTTGDAAMQLIAAYLAGALFARPSKLASMFKRCVAPAELDAAITVLVANKPVATAEVDGNPAIVAQAAKLDRG